MESIKYRHEYRTLQSQERIVVQAIELSIFLKELGAMGVLKDIIDGIDLAVDVNKIAQYIHTLFKVKGKVYIKEIPGGVKYVIFKGYPGKRAIIKGIRYLASSPLEVTIGLASKAKRLTGSVVGISFLVSFGSNIVEHLCRDKFLLEDFLKDTAVSFRNDIITLLAGAAAAQLAASSILAIASTGLVITPIIAGALPLAAGFIVSYYVGELLDDGILEKMISELIQGSENFLKQLIDSLFFDFYLQMEFEKHLY